MNTKQVINQLLSYFFQGVLLIVPFATTVYVLYELFILIDSLIPIELFPGSGILIIVTFLTLLGILGSTIIVKPFTTFFTRFLKRAPLIKVIYDAIKDLVSAFVGKKKSFNSPVLVRMSKDSTVEKLGFVTTDDLSELGIKDKVAVYLPHSYAFSGNLYIVSTEYITPVKAKSGDVMKFIISGGVAQSGQSDDDQASSDQSDQ
tara:strand:- start:3094 stop:3702 length:609 start_codon:yes stop_codon:yes gene_type:complete